MEGMDLFVEILVKATKIERTARKVKHCQMLQNYLPSADPSKLFSSSSSDSCSISSRGRKVFKTGSFIALRPEKKR